MDATEQYCLLHDIPPAHRHGDAATASDSPKWASISNSETTHYLGWCVCAYVCVSRSVGLSIRSVLS